MHFRLFDLNPGEARELQSNLVRSHSRRLGALDGRWRPVLLSAELAPLPAPAQGKGQRSGLKNCFPVSARTEGGRPALGGKERPRKASFLLRADGDAAAAAAGSGRPQESRAHLGVHCAPARNGEGSFRQLQKTQKPNAKCL